jgi:hypothetical protein
MTLGLQTASILLVPKFQEVMEDQPNLPASLPKAMDHLKAFMLLDEMEENIQKLSADFREFRFRIAQLGLLDKDEINHIAE